MLRKICLGNARKGLAQLTILLFTVIIGNPSALANEISPLSNGYHIRQEHLDQGGVLVSRPVEEDKRIFDLIDLYNIRSFEDYAHWLQTHLKYAADQGGDHWAQPLETLKKRQGDCEDFRLLNIAVARVLGYKARFLALLGDDKTGHAISVIEHENQFLWFDNEKLNTWTASSFAEFARQIIEKYQYSRLLELNLDTQEWSLVLKAEATPAPVLAGGPNPDIHLGNSH